MIVDYRGPDQMFYDPPGVGLVTGDGFSNFESDGIADFGILRSLEFVFGESDVNECFHRLRWRSKID